MTAAPQARPSCLWWSSFAFHSASCSRALTRRAADRLEVERGAERRKSAQGLAPDSHMRSTRRTSNAPAERPTADLHAALAGDAKAVSALLAVGWTLWISPAILQGKRGVVELRHQSAEGRERYSLPVLTFLTLRDEGTITAQQTSVDDLWVRCSLSERALSTAQPPSSERTPESVASSAA